MAFDLWHFDLTSPIDYGSTSDSLEAAIDH